MDNHPHARSRVPVPHTLVTKHTDLHSKIPSFDNLQKKKMRIIIICAFFFFLLNLVFVLVFLTMISDKKSAQTEIPQSQVVTGTSEETAKPEEEAQNQTIELSQEESEEKSTFPQEKPDRNSASPQFEDSTTEDLTIDEGSVPPLDTTTLFAFENSFFKMYEKCSATEMKEKCLFAFLVLHIYFDETHEEILSWSGCRPSEFISLFSKAISTPEFKMFPLNELADSEKQQKEDELLRIISSIQEKIKRNRVLAPDDKMPEPYPLHFELFMIVKSNPSLNLFLNKSIKKYEQFN